MAGKGTPTTTSRIPVLRARLTGEQRGSPLGTATPKTPARRVDDSVGQIASAQYNAWLRKHGLQASPDAYWRWQSEHGRNQPGSAAAEEEEPQQRQQQQQQADDANGADTAAGLGSASDEVGGAVKGNGRARNAEVRR